MPIKYDLTKDIRFKEGVEVGIKMVEKIAAKIGERRKARSATIRMLKHGLLSVVTIAEVLDVSLDFVLKIQEELERNPDLK